MGNTRYENFVLENQLTDQLNTRLNLRGDIIVDPSLQAEAGATVKVHKYAATGDAQKVTEGNGNTQSIEMSYSEASYTVGTTQARFVYTDEDEMTDPFLVEGGIRNLAVKLDNALNDDIVTAWEETGNTVEYSAAPGYSDFVDAIALLNIEDDESGSESAQLFALCNPAMKAVLRKGLKDELKYVEDHVRTGYIGTVCGIPIRASKAMSDGIIVLATREAVKYWTKKAAQTEQERNGNTRTNTVYGRTVGVVALVDESKCALIAPVNTAYELTTDTTVQSGTTYYTKHGIHFTEVTPASGDNPKTKGWYVEAD